MTGSARVKRAPFPGAESTRQHALLVQVCSEKPETRFVSGFYAELALAGKNMFNENVTAHCSEEA
jgi:hypothetical protein